MALSNTSVKSGSNGSVRSSAAQRPPRDLEVLDAIAENQHITQRTLASKLDIAVGLANLYIKRLVRKGFVKCVNVRSNRILYLLTPKGITEKTRLTYEFMQFSLSLYGQVRQHLRTELAPCAVNKSDRVAIYGAGEAAELAYLALRELGVDPVAVFGSGDGSLFLGAPVARLSDASPSDYDLLVVATFDRGATILDELTRDGVPAEKLLPLRPLSHFQRIER